MSAVHFVRKTPLVSLDDLERYLMEPNSPSTHQSQGKREDTQEVQELYVLQSKKVKLVATKSGPFSTLTDSLDVKWDSPLGIRGSKSFLKHKIFNSNST